MKPLLSVTNLSVQFKNKNKMLTAVDRLSFDVQKGEILGIVGESGCGKSAAALAIVRLLPESARISGGEVLLDGRNISGISEKEMCEIRGNEIAMIFQDPMTALNPTMIIGKQMIEPFMIHQKMSREEAWESAVKMLKETGIAAPEKRMLEYPHQMSGGMLQRIVIAMALSCRPRLLIADEPTTALDVTIQAQILDLMCKLREEFGTSIILITHDMGVVAETADSVMVLYAGQNVEYSDVKTVFKHPKHPYTKALNRSIPNIHKPIKKLAVIPGMVPMLDEMPDGCRFAPRCEYAAAVCRTKSPEMYRTEDGEARCFLYKMENKHDE